MFAKLVQPLKALLPTDVQPERSRLATLVQPENVSLPTEVQFERLTIVERFVLSFNALFPSVKELCGKATAERLAVFVTPLFAIATFVVWLKSSATEPEAGSVICVMLLLPALFTLTVPEVWFTTSSLGLIFQSGVKSINRLLSGFLGALFAIA